MWNVTVVVMPARAVLLLTISALLGLTLPAGVGAAVVGENQEQVVERVGDSEDVVTAAIELSQRAFLDGTASYVVVGRNDEFPDNLAATSLAGTRAPVLFTDGGPSASVRPEVLTEIGRALPPPVAGPCLSTDDVEVYLLGGINAVSAQVEQDISAAGFCVIRLEGATRFETAARIAAEVRDRFGSTEVIIARADDWADAATGGAYAALTDTPVVVTSTTSLHPAARAFLTQPGTSQDGPFTRGFVLGGTAAIDQPTFDEITQLVDMVRVAGSARDVTALEIRSQLWGAQGDGGITLINGYTEFGWAYAFAAAPLSAQARAPQLYTQPDTLITTTCTALSASAVQFLAVVGPATTITEPVVDAARTAITGGGCSSTPAPTGGETLAVVIDPRLGSATYPPGIYLAQEDGSSLRLLAPGNFSGIPSWSRGQDLIAVPGDPDGDGNYNAVQVVDMAGTVSTYVEAAPGLILGNVAINPQVTKTLEVVFEEVDPPAEDQGGDAAVNIISYSDKGGRLAITESGSALMSAEPYSSTGMLAFSEGGNVLIDDLAGGYVVVDQGSFSTPEWSPDGDLAYQTNDGLRVITPYSDQNVPYDNPSQFGLFDWLPTAPQRLAVSRAGEGGGAVDIIEVSGGVGTVMASVPGFGPDASPSGRYLAVQEDGGGIVVHDLTDLQSATELDILFTAYAYPSATS